MNVSRALRSTGALLVLALSTQAHAEKDAVAREIDELWNALETGDLKTFDAVLDRGVLDPTAFDRYKAHYTLCESTVPGNEPFLLSLLDHGVNPDNTHSEFGALDRNALACASTRYNLKAFDILLDAGADTTTNLCAPCEDPRTIFTISSNMPPFSSRILERRRLTAHEAQNLAIQVERISLANSHEGQPTWQWYQNLLRDEYGIDGLQPFSARERN